MTSRRVTTASAPVTDAVVLWINRALEALWLLVVILVPLAFLGRDTFTSEAVIGYVEVPKIALLRTLVALMAALWLIEWGVRGRLPTIAVFKADRKLRQPGRWLPHLYAWLRAQPTRFLVLAGWTFLGTTLLSTVLSGSRSVSLWGEVSGQDGYPAYTIAAYVLLFAVIATHLKTRSQLWRLVGAIVAMGVVVAGYAVFQHYGNDFLNLTETTGGGSGRVTSFMGNAIFSAAVMLMTIPITLIAAVSSLPDPSDALRMSRATMAQWARVVGLFGTWGAVLGVQLLGLVFTFSRGPWLGALFALLVALALMTVFVGWRAIGRATLVLGLAAAFALAVILWQDSVSIFGLGSWIGAVVGPVGLIGVATIFFYWRTLGRVVLTLGFIAAVVAAIVLVPKLPGSGGSTGSEATIPVSDESGSTASQVASRFSSIKADVSGGLLAGRTTHWRVSWELTKDRPWFEFDNLSLRWLRPVIGYGPDLFRYTYLLRSPAEGVGLLPLEPDHAHNFFIHQTVEQGILGLLSSIGIFAAAFGVGAYQLLRARDGLSDIHKLVLIGLLAVVAGRFLEMMVGVARVSDLTVLWVVLAIIAALPVAMGHRQAQVEQTPVPARRKSRPSRHSDRGGSGFDWPLYLRLAVIVWILGGLGVLTWVKSVNYVRAGVEVGDGLQLFRQGDFQSSLAALDRAIELAPDISLYYNHRASIYRGFQINQSVQPEQGCSAQTELPYRVCLAARSFQSNLDGMAQQPLYFRSRLAVANSAYNLPQLKDETVRLYSDALSLVPNSWLIQNELADAQLEAGQPEQALKTLEGSLAITKDSDLSAWAHFLQGIAYRQLGEHEKSISSLEAAVAMNVGGRRAREAHQFLEEEYSNLGRPRTIQDYTEALDRYPRDAGAFYHRGRAYSEMGEIAKAMEDFNMAIFYDGQHAPAYLGRGDAFLAQGRINDAIINYEEAIRINPQSADGYSKRGLALLFLGQFRRDHQRLNNESYSGLFQQATQALEDAIRLDPQYAQAYVNRSRLFSDQGLHRRAVQDLDEAIRIDPLFVQAWDERGRAYTSMGEHQRAIRDLDEAIRLDPTYARAYNSRGSVFVGLGQFERAIVDYDEAIRLDPLSAQAWVERGRAYTGMGEHQRAIRDLNEAIRLDPTYARAYNSRGSAFVGLGQFERAIVDYSEAIRLDPQPTVSFYNRGVAFTALGLYESALRDLDEALRLDASYVPTYGALGQTYTGLGEYGKAVNWFDKALQFEPENIEALSGRAVALVELGN